VTEVSLDTHALGHTTCVTFDPAVVTITPDTTVVLTPDYSNSTDAPLFVFRRTSSEASGHCPANSVGVYTGAFTSAAPDSPVTLTAAAEEFYIAVM